MRNGLFLGSDISIRVLGWLSRFLPFCVDSWDCLNGLLILLRQRASPKPIWVLGHGKALGAIASVKRIEAQACAA